MLIPKKSLGQNFLIDKNICNKISNLSELKNKIVIEIGPGTGQLTDQLILKNPKQIILIEKDNDLYSKLIIKYKRYKNLTIFNTDALKFDYSNYKNIIVISNLPYNLSAKFIILLLKNFQNIKEMIFMIQKDVSKKMNYTNIKKNKYNVFIELLSKYEIKFDVSNKVFYPKPKVQSTVVKLIPKNNKLNKELLWIFCSNLFRNKRKKISNAIKTEKIDSKYLSLKNNRAEDLLSKDILYLFKNF